MTERYAIDEKQINALRLELSQHIISDLIKYPLSEEIKKAREDILNRIEGEVYSRGEDMNDGEECHFVVRVSEMDSAIEDLRCDKS